MAAVLLQVVLLLVATVATLQAQSCRQSPITIGGLAEDFNRLFPGLPDNVLLVDRGTVPVFLRSPGVSEQLALRDDITIIPLVWFSSAPAVNYSFGLFSLEPDILNNPIVSIDTNGILPVRPFRYHMYLLCRQTRREGVAVRVEINATSTLDGEPYCGVVFYFGKHCRTDGEILDLGSGAVLDANDSYVNVSFFSEPNMTTFEPPIVAHAGSIVPAVLVPTLTVLLTIAVVVVAVWTVWYVKIRKKRKQLELVAIGAAFRRARTTYRRSRTPHHREFPAKNLQTSRKLGEGAFGVVYEGIAEGIDGSGQTIVAVKQLHSGDEDAKEEFFREVSFMSQLNHDHVVKLLGVCTLEEPFSMIFEFMDLGDLCSFLRDALVLGEDGAYTMLTVSELLSVSLQIAKGAEYIAGLNLVHRDLACRNCLISTGLVVKIADFGMSRNLYSVDYYRVQGSALLPLRWMAPECVLYGKFSEASDVWSFGVLCWEIFMFGQQPFAGLANEEVLGLVSEGKHPTPPDDCPAHQLMLDCWEWSTKNRPTFNELVRFLSTLLHDQLKNENEDSSL